VRLDSRGGRGGMVKVWCQSEVVGMAVGRWVGG
jgi:hypothetical protein